jgi:hypothetical protein
MIKNLFSSNKREFFPGKAYLIEGKGVEQVKDEIKEWLEKNFGQITEYEDESIMAQNFFTMIEACIELKLYPNKSGAIILYSKRRYILDIESFWRVDNYLVDELKNDLVRYVQKREELLTPLIRKFLILRLSPFIIPFATFFLSILGHAKFELVYPLGLLSVAMFIIVNYLFKRKIQKLSNLPEYKVKEYKGDVTI